MLLQNEILFLVLLLTSCNAMILTIENMEGVHHVDDRNGSRLLGNSKILDQRPVQLERSASDCESKKMIAQNCSTSKCGSCIDSAFATVLVSIQTEAIDCSVISGGMCPSITTNCDCEPCQQSIEDYFRCYFSSFTDGACFLDCSSTETPESIGTEEGDLTSASDVRGTFSFFTAATGTMMMGFFIFLQ